MTTVNKQPFARVELEYDARNMIAMTLHNMTTLFSRFTYKPNWKFVLQDRGRFVELTATQWVEDSRADFEPWNLEEKEYALRPIDAWGTAEIVRHSGPVSPRRPLVAVSSRVTLPEEGFFGEKHFWHWIRYELIPRLEDHEISEWFRVDGKLMLDPHKEKM